MCSSDLFGHISTYLYMYYFIVKKILGEGISLCDASGTNSILSQYRALTVLSHFFNATYCKRLVPGFKCTLGLFIMMSMLISTRLQSRIQGNSTADTILPYISRGLMLAAVYHFINLTTSSNMLSNLWKMSTAFVWEFRRRRLQGKMEKRKYVDACAQS